jgi:hypothetical protein
MKPENKQSIYYAMALVLACTGIYGLLQLKFGIFSQPYLWDELGVYSRASMHLFNNGLSLMPSAIPDELSRGHPLLCSFYFALAFKIFGCSPVTAHVAAAFLNIFGFYCVFRILARYMEGLWAIVITITIFIQPLFLSQSVLILPEMPLMVVTLAAVMCYLYGQKWGVVISLVAALQIKESALVLPLAFFLSDLVNRKKVTGTNFLFYLMIPLLSFATFICLQKYQRGYFFYPLHTSLSSFDLYYIRERWENFKQYAFYEQGHLLTWVMFCVVIFFFIVARFKDVRVLLKDRRLILPVIITGCIGFMVLNYYLSRYTLYFMVLYYILLFLLLMYVLRPYVYLRYLLVLLVFISGVYHWNRGKVYTDVDFTYSAHLDNMRAVVKEMNEATYKGKTVGMDFPLCAAYWSKDNGYPVTDNIHSVPINDSLPVKEFVVFTHPGNMADTAKYGGRIDFVKQVSTGYAYSRIYALRPVLTTTITQ